MQQCGWGECPKSGCTRMAKTKGYEINLIASRTPEAWFLDVKGRIQSLGEKIDQNNGRQEYLI